VINARAAEPLFEQIAAALRDQIRSGRIRPGQLLPSETRLGQTYGVNSKTARAAVTVLRAEGLAELVRGRGVVVREPVELQDLVVSAGAVVAARMPTAEERRAYDIPVGVPVFSVAGVDGSMGVFPADRWQLRLPSDG
jgi:DNA-binding FadR family transcriptional regulator